MRGEKMIVYIDVVFAINLIFDYSLLLTTDLILKRNANLKKVLLGAFIGELSLITLFVQFNSTSLFVFKVLLSFLMSICTFGYKDKKYTTYNVVYLYLMGIILGGFITYLYNEFKINREYSLKYILILSVSLIGLFIYYKLITKMKNDYNNRYKVIIYYEDKIYEGLGFLDSGNTLASPISGKPIILIEKEYITLHKLKLLPVPFNALNHRGLVYCFKPDRLIVNDKEYKDILVGLSDIKFNLDGVSILLNSKMEGI